MRFWRRAETLKQSTHASTASASRSANLVGIILTNQSRLNPQNFITEGDTRTRRITERALRAYGSAIAREIS